jgi:hypothetical protein
MSSADLKKQMAKLQAAFEEAQHQEAEKVRIWEEAEKR